MILFLFSLVLSSPSDHSISVCHPKCPDGTPGFLIEVAQAGDDISAKVDSHLGGTNTQIYFYNESNFVFQLNLKIFQGHTVEFLRLDDSKPVDVDIDCTEMSGKSTGSFTFRRIYVDFSSLVHLSNLEFDGFTVEESTFDLFNNIESSLIVGSLTADSSILAFSTISIKTSYSSSTGATINADSSSSLSVSASDNGADVMINRKTISFSYDSTLSSKRLDFVNTDLSGCVCEVEYHCSDISKLIQLSFIDFQKLYYLNSWPETAITNVKIDDGVSLTIFANSTVLPITLTEDKDIPAIIVITQESTVITGSILASAIFSNPNDKFLIRKSIRIAGSFSGALLDLGSSYYDVTLSNFDFDTTSYGDLPFAFRVGTGGASTLNVLKSASLTSKKNGIYIYPDFTKYLPDESLQNLLNKEWTILTLAGVSFSLSYVNIKMQDTPFIHGFIDGDSCISVRIESNKMILTASPPSLLPLNICYDGDKEGGECSSDDGIEVDSIDMITDYFEDGMKYLNLSIKTFHLTTLDLTSLDYGYEGVRVILRGGSNTVLDQIYTKEGLGIEYLEINDLILGSNTFWIKQIAFNNVKVDGHPTFTFKNCEIVYADDSFIQNISPSISSSGKIGKITYRMDKYDAMTVADDKFIFYDIAMNDLSDPAELDYEVVNFLDIIYDVGLTETAEDNDLNVTMETKNPPSFNITFSAIYSTGIWDNPALILYSWSQTESADFKTYFIHDDLNVKIILTQPYKPAQLIPVGTGIVTYEDRYEDSLYLCSVPDADKDTCPDQTTFVSYGDLNKKLTESKENNITVYIKSNQAGCPSVDIYNVNKKTTYFIGLQKVETTPTDFIEITSSKEVDFILTANIFKDISVKTTSQTTSLLFGELTLENAGIDSSFKNVEVKVDDLFCEYKYLSMFKKVTITDNLVVNGDLASETSTVEFIPDNDANDLNATIKSDVTLLMGDKYIQIGKTKFQFGSMETVYDIVLYFESGVKNVQINKDNAASEDTIPNVQIRKASGASFTFANDWKKSTRTQPHIFLFSDFDKTKVYISGPNTPVSFSADGELTIISKAETAGVTGYFDFHDMTKTGVINVLYEGVSKSVINVEQYISIVKDITIRFTQPNIEFDIDTVTGYSRDASKIQPELFSNLDGDSLLVIKDRMNNVIISRDYKAQVPITEDVSNQKVIDYYSKKHKLIKINPGDTGSSLVRTFTLIGTQPTTHGFKENNMNMEVDELTGEISLYFKKSPLLIPYILCYKFDEATDSCEIKLTEDNINNFADLLPSGVLTIQARFGEENTNFFNLNIPKIKGSTVIVSQQMQAQLAVKMQLGTDIISLLSLNQVSGRIMDYSTFKVNRVEISNGAEIDQINGFGIINIDYDTIWKVQDFPKCTNEIILNLTASSLTFTNKGWSVNTDTDIDQSSYPNLKFQLDSYITTRLEAASGITEIKETTIYTKSKKFVLGSNWDSITSLSTKVNIIFETDDTKNIEVTTSSYPFIAFPQLMNAGTVQIDPSVLPYEVTKKVTFLNVISEIDFSNVKDTPEKAHINFASLTFKGLSSLSAKGYSNNNFEVSNGINPITIERLEVVDDTTSTLNNALVNKFLGVYGSSSIYGDFDVSVDLDIVMKWKLNKMPQILIKTIPDKVPQLITFSFDDASIDGKEKLYENYLYHKSFELIRINKQTRCETWKSILVFDSPNVTLFGSETIFDLSCDETKLILYGARHVYDSNSGHKKLSPGAIVGIVFAIIIVIGASCFGIYIYLKKKRSSYQQLNTDVLESSELNQAQYTK